MNVQEHLEVFNWTGRQYKSTIDKHRKPNVPEKPSVTTMDYVFNSLYLAAIWVSDESLISSLFQFIKTAIRVTTHPDCMVFSVHLSSCTSPVPLLHKLRPTGHCILPTSSAIAQSHK